MKIIKTTFDFIKEVLIGIWLLIQIPLLVAFGVIYVGKSDRTDDFAVICKMIFCGSIILTMLYTVMRTLIITSWSRHGKNPSICF